MLIDSFELLVSYHQIAVFDAMLSLPFNDWRPEHVRQGFVWRPRSVSFGVLDDLPMTIEVRIAESVRIRDDALRVIRVPFLVVPEARLEVATVAFERDIAVPPGAYALWFEHGQHSNQPQWTVFTFVPALEVSPAVLRADSELSPPDELDMTADPA